MTSTQATGWEPTKKSIAIALAYRHPERTLTDEEAAELHAKVVDALERSFGAELRK